MPGSQGTGHIVKTDLYDLFDYSQSGGIGYCKELILETLREFFSKDSYYHYQADSFGFPKTVETTGLPQDAGLNDSSTTRLYIGETYRYDITYFPAILIRSGGTRYVPTSMNRDKGTIQWKVTRFIDGYGTISDIRTPSHFIQAGAWEGSVNIEVLAGSPIARDELVDLIIILFTDARFEELRGSGVVIRGTSVGGPSESDDRNNKIYKQTVTLDIRSEWRRQIAIDSVIDAINLCVDFGNLEVNPPALAPNLKIASTLELIDQINQL